MFYNNISLRRLALPTSLLAVLLAPGIVVAENWKLIGITGQQGDTTPAPAGGFLYPDHTLYDLDPLFTDPFLAGRKNSFKCPS